jgi:NitT/TauT family transport system permease protein
MPIFILFFGIGELVKISVVAWVCVWPILFNTIEGARNVDPVMIKTARAMASPPGEMFFKIILPGSSSSIFAGLKLGLEMSFFMLVVAEMVGATYGLGWLLHNSAMNFQLVRMYAAILASVILGFGMNAFLKTIQTRVFILHRKGDLGFAGALVALILIVGSWQVQVSRREQAAFNHAPHSAHMSAGTSGME